MSTFQIAYEQAGMYSEALEMAREEWVRAHDVSQHRASREKALESSSEGVVKVFNDAARYAALKADSLTLEIERLDAFLKEHKPKGKKGRRKQ